MCTGSPAESPAAVGCTTAAGNGHQQLGKDQVANSPKAKALRSKISYWGRKSLPTKDSELVKIKDY